MNFFRRLGRFTFDSDVFLLIALLCLLLIFALTPDQDISVYHCYVNAFWHGGHILSDPSQNWCTTFVTQSSLSPFQTLPTEYPPLSLVIFSLPLLIAFLPYGVSFTFLLCLLIAAVFFFIRSHISKNAGLLFLISILLSATTIANRYDLIPSVCVLLSLIAAEKKAFSRSYLFLAVATLLKIYPLILFLPLFLAEQTRWKGTSLLFWKRYRLIGLSFASFGVSFLIAHLLSGGNAFGFIRFMLTRPLQIESVATSFLWVISLIHQFSFCIIFTYGSLGIGETHAASCAPILSPSLAIIGITTLSVLAFTAGTLIAVIRLQKKHWTITQTAIALLLLTLCTSKVLSPQYFIWLIPLVVWDKNRKPLWLALWLFLLFLTALIHPWLYRLLGNSLHTPIHTGGETIFFFIVLLRNLILIAATLFWFRMPAKVRAPK